jgi:hypothetical protein
MDEVDEHTEDLAADFPLFEMSPAWSRPLGQNTGSELATTSPNTTIYNDDALSTKQVCTG